MQYTKNLVLGGSSLKSVSQSVILAEESVLSREIVI